MRMIWKCFKEAVYKDALVLYSGCFHADSSCTQSDSSELLVRLKDSAWSAANTVPNYIYDSLLDSNFVDVCTVWKVRRRIFPSFFARLSARLHLCNDRKRDKGLSHPVILLWRPSLRYQCLAHLLRRWPGEISICHVRNTPIEARSLNVLCSYKFEMVGGHFVTDLSLQTFYELHIYKYYQLPVLQ